MLNILIVIIFVACIFYFYNKDTICHYIPLSKTAYYINLPEQPSRRQHTHTLLTDLGFENINRITPIPDQIPFKSLSKTHIHIIKTIAQLQTNQYYFVFEDDIELANGLHRKDFFKFVQDDLSTINTKNKVEFIYLGACLENDIVHSGGHAFEKHCSKDKCKCWCAHAYMLTPKGARWILQHSDETVWENHHADFYFLKLFSQPLIGYHYTHDHTSPGWRGLFYQARKAPWYEIGNNEKIH